MKTVTVMMIMMIANLKLRKKAFFMLNSNSSFLQEHFFSYKSECPLCFFVISCNFFRENLLSDVFVAFCLQYLEI